jgi:CubicO group peptidase (beta-lactamase class C family)
MTTRRAIPWVLSLLLGAASVGAAEQSSRSELPRSSPESQGISSSAILRFLDAAEGKIDSLHSFMLLRHGHVVAEGWWSPYGANDPHMLFSLSKSFTSTAVGLAVSQGLMTIDDTVLSHFPEDAPASPSNNLKGMRVRDLLSMSSGQDKKVIDEMLKTPDTTWTKAFLAAPVEFKPGTHFVYNTPATYMLSAIVQKVTGKTVLDYLRPRLFEPLGIENPTWGTSPQGITLGGWGLNLKTEDVARFGQLYLQKGEWQGRRVLPAEWIAAATARQTSNGSSPTSDWDQGYGYQFWRCRHGLYRGDGAHGQFCIVMPEQDAVVAITSGTRDLQGVMNAVWDNLLPALQSGPLPADDAAQAQLRLQLTGLSLKPIQGKPTSPLVRKVSGKTYAFPANEQKLESLALQFGKDGATVVVHQNGGAEQRIACGSNAWRKGRTSFTEDTEQPVAASGAWTSDDAYRAKLCFYETPFCTTLALRFEGDQLFFDVETNVNRDTKHAQLVGRTR